MITEKQLKIFEAFAKRPFAEFTRKQIKKDTKQKSNNALALTINRLKKEEILAERKIGKNGILTLNMANDLTVQYIALSNNKRLDKTAKTVITRINEEIAAITPFYSLTVFGSYAVNEQKESSDLDIAIFIETKNKQKQIEAALNSARMKTLIKIDSHIIPKKEMIEMLTNDEENLGKQIARKHLAVHNPQIFYEIIKEGIKHGFRA